MLTEGVARRTGESKRYYRFEFKALGGHPEGRAIVTAYIDKAAFPEGAPPTQIRFTLGRMDDVPDPRTMPLPEI